jgi:hypothetical protein
MGAFSTIRIRRSRARLAAMQYVMSATDEELAAFMDQLLAERLYNVRIVNDDAENDDERL